MKIKPLNDRILVGRLEEEQKTAGGIIIPDTAKEKPQQGEVVAAGPTTANERPRRSRSVIGFCSPSMPAPKSRWTVSSICS